MLIVVLELRDRLIAGELDIERLQASQPAALVPLAAMHTMAGEVAALADALLLGRTPSPPATTAPRCRRCASRPRPRLAPTRTTAGCWSAPRWCAASACAWATRTPPCAS
jgi:hypothetical protein